MSRKRRRPFTYVTCKHCLRDFRAVTASHLRRSHGYDHDHPIDEYKRRFRVESVLCRESRNLIRDTTIARWARQGRHWAGTKVIAEIRRIHRDRKSLRQNRVPVRLCLAGRRYFGSWKGAVEKAGLDYESVTGIRRWSQGKVIERIRQLAIDRVALDATHIKRRYPFLYKAAIKLYPSSWAKALRAAGLNRDEHRQPRGKWERETAAHWVRERAAKGRSLWARDVPVDVQVFVRKRLGTNWARFVESLGIPYPGLKRRRDWTNAKVLSEIRQWAKSHPMNYKAVQRTYQALLIQAKKFFGSWNLARAAARV